MLRILERLFRLDPCCELAPESRVLADIDKINALPIMVSETVCVDRAWDPCMPDDVRYKTYEIRNPEYDRTLADLSRHLASAFRHSAPATIIAACSRLSRCNLADGPTRKTFAKIYSRIALQHTEELHRVFVESQCISSKTLHPDGNR